MTSRLLSGMVLVGLLIASAPALGARGPVDPLRIRDAIQQEWVRVAPPGALLEIRAVPSLRSEEDDPEIDILLPDEPLRPGPRAVPVSLRRDGRIVSRGLANVVIRREIRVWVADRALAAGETLLAADLREETRVVEREPSRRFDFDPAQSWRLSRDLEPGALLRATDVERIADIEAGEEILLVARAGTATVSVPGRARQSGDVGRTILVHNPVTGALVRAVVLDSGTARLVQAGDTTAGETR